MQVKYDKDTNTTTFYISSFQEWFAQKTGKAIAISIDSMTEAQKRELYLMWKHGLSNPKANEEIEASERELVCKILTPFVMAKMDAIRKEYFRRKIMLAERCNIVRRLLRLPEWKILAFLPD